MVMASDMNMAFLNSLLTAMGIRYIHVHVDNFNKQLTCSLSSHPFKNTKNHNSRKKPFLYYEFLKKKLNASSIKWDAVNWEAFIPNSSREEWEESVSFIFVCPIFAPVGIKVSDIKYV